MSDSPTNAQNAVYATIEDFIDEHGYAPSTRELCELRKLSSPSTMNTHLKALRDKGYISYVDGQARTIVLLKTPCCGRIGIDDVLESYPELSFEKAQETLLAAAEDVFNSDYLDTLIREEIDAILDSE